jgi:hypothetical protein
MAVTTCAEGAPYPVPPGIRTAKARGQPGRDAMMARPAPRRRPRHTRYRLSPVAGSRKSL